MRPATAKQAGREPAAREQAPVAPRPQTNAGTVIDEPPVQRPAPRSNPSARPWLDIAGDRYPLLGSITTLGRDETADIVIDDPGVSRRHSEIRVTTDGPHLVTSIRDLNSTNGTFVNGDRVEPAAPGRRPPDDRPHVRDVPRGSPVSRMSSLSTPCQPSPATPAHPRPATTSGDA